MIRTLAIAICAALLAAGGAAAEEAVVLRTSAPNVPAALRVTVGQMLDVPDGAAVTLLYRDGRIVTLRGAAGARVRVTPPPAARSTPMAEALSATFARPEARSVLGATRAPDVEAALAGMRRGAFPQGDYIDQFVRGCRTSVCQALEAYVDEAVGPSLHIRTGVSTGVSEEQTQTFIVTTSHDARITCWRFDPEGGVAAVAPFDGAQTLARNAVWASSAGVRVAAARPKAERFVGCVASPSPVDAPTQARLVTAGSGGADAFIAEAAARGVADVARY
jgi:hypothetical protein